MGGLCEPCADANHPPIEARGQRLSPLVLGLLSFADVFLFLSGGLALCRALAELRQVREREAFGLWRPEHRTVRTQAAWGITLGSANASVAAVFSVTLFGAVIAQSLFYPLGPPPPPYDELQEVLTELRSGDAARSRLALSHLPPALARDASPGATARALEAVLSLEDEALQARAVDAVLAGRAVPWDARLEALTHALHADSSSARRRRLLELLAQDDRTDALAAALHLHGADPAPLAELPEGAAIDGAMLGLPDRHPYQALGAERFASRCGHRPPAPAEVQAHMERAVVGAVARIDEASVDGRVPRIQHAVALVPGLLCLSQASAESRLEAAASHAEPRVAVAAILALRDREHRLPERHAARLRRALTDPMARAYWHRRGGDIPAEHRGDEAVAIAEGAAALEQAGHRCDAPRPERVRRYRGVRELAHRWRCTDGVERLTYSPPLAAQTPRWVSGCVASLRHFAWPQPRSVVVCPGRDMSHCRREPVAGFEDRLACDARAR